MLLEASLATQVTVFVPLGKVEPDGGEQPVIPDGQFSNTMGWKVTFEAEHCPGSIESMISPGQVRSGGSISRMVTVNEQLWPLVAEQVTTFVPLAKKLPEGGVQLIWPHPPDPVAGG